MTASKKKVTIIVVAAVVVIAAVFVGLFATGNLGGTISSKQTYIEFGNTTELFDSVGDALSKVNQDAYKGEDITLYFGEDYKANKKIEFAARTGKLTLDLQGHTVGRTNTDFVEYGEIFCFMKSGDITIKNGTLTGARNKTSGGAIYVMCDDLKLTLDNITMTDNKTMQTGGGMYVEYCNATITIADCTIQNNKSNGWAGGVFDARNGKQAKFIFSGKTIIKDNTGGSDNDNMIIDRTTNEYVAPDISGLTAGSEIVFGFSNHTPEPFDVILTGTNPETGAEQSITIDEAAKYLVSDYNNAKIVVKDGKLAYTLADECVATVEYSGGPTYYFNDFAAAWNEVCGNDKTVKMTMYKDWTGKNGSLGSGTGFDDGAIYPNKRSNRIHLEMNNHTINRDIELEQTDGCVMYINHKCKMLITNGVIRGGKTSGKGGGIFVNSASDLNLRNVTITNNYSREGGAGLALKGDCDVTLKNATVQYNTSVGKGGAIGVYGVSSSLILDDVCVTNNNSASYGVYYEQGYLHLRNKVKIYGNKDSTGKNSNLFIYIYDPHRIEDCDMLTDGSEIWYCGTSRKVTYDLIDPQRVLKYFHSDTDMKEMDISGSHIVWK